MGLLNFIQGSFTHRLPEENRFKVYAVQRSELLDDKTCNYCLSMDERTVKPGDSITSYQQFHPQCRGIWVEIGIEETEKPVITGIQKHLRDKAGSLGDFHRMSKAIPLSGSLAEEFINERRKKKY